MFMIALAVLTSVLIVYLHFVHCSIAQFLNPNSVFTRHIDISVYLLGPYYTFNNIHIG